MGNKETKEAKPDVISFAHLMFTAIEENNFDAFVQLLGETEEEKLANAQTILSNRTEGEISSKPEYLYINTPFLLCAIYGRYKMMEVMLNIPNINVNEQDENGMNALANYCWS